MPPVETFEEMIQSAKPAKVQTFDEIVGEVPAPKVQSFDDILAESGQELHKGPTLEQETTRLAAEQQGKMPQARWVKPPSFTEILAENEVEKAQAATPDIKDLWAQQQPFVEPAPQPPVVAGESTVGEIVNPAGPTRQPGKFRQGTKQAYEVGRNQVDIDFLWDDVSQGKITEEQAQKATKEFQNQLTADPLKARNWAENLWQQTVQILPGMVGGYKAGAKAGLVGAGGAGVVGLAIPLPEEIATVPGAYAAGQIWGSVHYWAKQGRGAIYRQAREAGVSDETAKAAAEIGGPIYAAIEQSQVSKMVPSLTKKTILKAALEYAIDVGEQTSQEGVQRLVTEGANSVAKRVDGLLDNTGLAQEMKDNVWKSVDEMRQALGPMAVLRGGRLATDIVKGEPEAKPEPARPPTAPPYIGEQGPTVPVEVGGTIPVPMPPAIQALPAKEAQRGQPIPAPAETVAAPGAVEEAKPGAAEPAVAAEGPAAVAPSVREAETAEGTAAGKAALAKAQASPRPWETLTEDEYQTAREEADAQVPLGLYRPVILNMDFRTMSEDALFKQAQRAAKEVDALELQWDENTALDFDMEFRRKLSAAQEQYSTLELEKWRRHMGSVSGEDVARKFMKLDDKSDEDKLKMILMLDEVKKSGEEAAFNAELKKIQSVSPDWVRLVKEQLADAAAVVQEYRTKTPADAALAKAGEEAAQPASPAQRESPSLAETFEEGVYAGSVMEGGEVRPGQGAWRSMGQKEFDRLVAGEELGGLEKAGKRGGWFSWFPARSAMEKGKPGSPKYLVEFADFETEGEALTQPVRVGDVTGLWKSEGGEWQKIPIPTAAPETTGQPVAPREIVPPAAPGATWGEAVKRGSRVTVPAKTQALTEKIRADKKRIEEEQEPEKPFFPPGKTTEGAGGPPVELGGMPRKPPGLTSAETQHLSKRGRGALRAGQATGEKIGYKLGERHTWDKARSVITRIGIAGKMSDEHRKEAGRIVTEFLPKAGQGVYIRRILQARTPKRVARIMESIHVYLDRAHKRQAIRSLKTTVGEIRGKYRRGEVALGGMQTDLRDRMIAVLDAYDPAKLSEEKAEELKEHEKFVQRIAGTVADAFADREHLNANGEDILLTPDSRWNDLKRLSKKPISEMDTDDIEAIEENLKHIVEIQELRNDARFTARRETLAKRINDSTNALYERETTGKGEIRESGRLRKFAGVENASLRTLARSLAGKDATATEELLMDSLVEGMGKTNTKKKEWIEAARDVFKPIEAKISKGKSWDDTLFVTLGGKKIQITYRDLATLYAHTEADGNMRRMLRSKGMNMWSPRGKAIRIGRIKLEELQAAMKELPDVYREWVEAFFDFGYNYQAPAINETSVEFQGFPIATHRRHLSFHRETGRVPSGKQVDMESAAEAKGRYLPRTGGTQRFNLVPIDVEFVRGLQMDAAYYGTTIPMQNARTLLANEKWREKVLDNGGRPVLNEITTLLRRKEGMITEQTQAEMVMGRTLGRAGKAALSLRPTGSVVQIAGVPAAVEVIEIRYFRPEPVSRKEIQRLEGIDPNLWVRWQASQFDYVLGNVAAQNAFDHLIREKTPLSDKAVRHYTWGDQIQVYYVWRAAQRKVKAEHGFKPDTAENDAEALKLLNRAMETQGQWDILYRSTLTSNPSVFLRGSLMFASPRTAQYNVLLRAVDDLRKGRIGYPAFSKRVAGIATSSVLGGVIRRMFRFGVKVGVIAVLLGLRKEDEETVKQIIKNEALQDAAKIPADAAWDMIGLPAFGQAIASVVRAGVRKAQGSRFVARASDYRTGNLFGDIVLDGIGMSEDIGELVHAQFSGETERAKAAAKRVAGDAAQLVSEFTGAPYSGVMSDIVWPAKTVFSEARYIKISKPRRMQDEQAENAYGKLWDDLMPKEQAQIRQGHPEIATARREAEALRKPAQAIDISEQLESHKSVLSALPKSTAAALADSDITVGTARRIGSNYWLNDERYTAYRRYAAEEIERAAGPLTKSKGWEDRPDTVRDIFLQRAVNQARDKARERLMKDIESGASLRLPNAEIPPATRIADLDSDILDLIASRTYAQNGRRPDKTIYHVGDAYQGQEENAAILKADWERSTGKKLDVTTLRRAQAKLARQKKIAARQP